MRYFFNKIWSRVADIGLHPGSDPFQRRTVRLVNSLGIILSVFILSSVIINLAVQVYLFVPVLLCAFVVSLMIYPLNIKQKYEWAKITLMVVFIGLLTYMLFNGGTGAGLEFYFLSLLMLPVLIFRNAKLIYFFQLICVFALIAQKIYAPQKSLSDWENEPILKIFFIVNSIYSSFLIILSILFYRKISQKAQQELVDSARELREKDEFIGITSHELKTPLTTTKAYIEIIQSALEEKGELKLKEYAAKANHSLNKLHTLINDLLDVSKIQTGKINFNITTFEFENLLNECIENSLHLFNKHQIIKQGEVKVAIRGDKQRIEQVLMNYISNAVKYSPKSDRIIIHTTLESNNLKVAITDFGIGIPKEKQNRLFERFYRADETFTFPGFGIGLYISSEIIKRHNGKVWVDSEKDKGSTFYFTLPCN